MIHKISHIKYFRAALFVLISLMVLLVPGMINLKAVHQSPEATEDILKGSAPFFPFYINDFIFPARVKLHSESMMAPVFAYRSLFFPTKIRVINATSKDVYGSDTVTIQYNGNATFTVFSCDGTPLGPNQTMKSIYFIDAAGNFSCADIKGDTPLLTNAQVMIENVDSMRILYGIAKDHTHNEYVPSNHSLFSFPQVNYLTLNLLLRTFEADEDSQIKPYYQLGSDTVGPYHDNYPRRTLIFTLPVNKEAL